LFQDSTANAIAAVSSWSGTANGTITIPLIYQMQAGTTSSTTFKIRAGGSTGTVGVNGLALAGTRIFGGTSYSGLSVVEIFL
jgi:hypothetical protein